jgi:hypothetical protein
VLTLLINFVLQRANRFSFESIMVVCSNVGQGNFLLYIFKRVKAY